MMIKRLKIWILFLFFSSQLLGQDYIEYQRIFNRIDEDILTKNDTVAVDRLDSIYSNYEFVYAKHCMKALQICISANDSIQANKWLEKCFKQGIPIWLVESNLITNKSRSFSSTQQTFKSYDSLHLIRISTIDTNLERKIDSLLMIDQKFTQKVNNGYVLFLPVYWIQWRVNNKLQLKELKKIIEIYGYPEEKLLGLPFIQDSLLFSKHVNFWGLSELRDSRIQIMLQHCYSTGHKIDFNFSNILYENVCNGNLPPYQYALIMDFMMPNKRKYINSNFGFKEGSYNNIIHFNRYFIGLNTIEQEKRNTLIERDRRKNKRANSEIMLE